MSYALSLERFGDWAKANIVLQTLATCLTPAYVAQLQADGDFVLQEIKRHIEEQDLTWSPLSENTRKRQAVQGEDAIYVDTGFLYNNLRVLKVKSKANGATFFVGADAHVTTPTGSKLSDVLIWLEYGTLDMPPRPLIRPTWEDVKPVLKAHWTELLEGMTQYAGGIKKVDTLVVKG